MPARTPEERALIARIANAERLARTDNYADLTASARKGLDAKFERDAIALNPSLSGSNLKRAATALHRAHMLRMSLKAAQSRRRTRTPDSPAGSPEHAPVEAR